MKSSKIMGERMNICKEIGGISLIITTLTLNYSISYSDKVKSIREGFPHLNIEILNAINEKNVFFHCYFIKRCF